MTQTHLRWIRMPLPVDTNWKQFFAQDLHPFLEAADSTGVINQWYFNCTYKRGQLLDVYIQTDSTTVHTVLRPVLQKRYGSLVSPEHPDKLLAAISPAFTIVPADTEDDCLTDLHVISTQLVGGSSLGQSAVGDCFSEVSAALRGLDQDPAWLSAFAKIQLGNWLDQYFANRDWSDELSGRQRQETDLLKFLSQQQPIEQNVLIHAQKIGWIEGFQELERLYDGETYVENALNAHIKRRGLTALEEGQMWLMFATENAAAGAGLSTHSN